MKTTDEYVYYENNWFSEMKRNNDNLMWRYWAAKEMANTISISFHKLDKEYQYVFEINKRHLNNLVQILKKEWFK